MKRLLPAIFIIFAFTAAKSQSDFQTIVTQGPIVAGESFQVQYVLENTDKDNEFFAPDFKGFRFVSGPNIYTGTAYGAGRTRKLKNIVYTLVATGPGKFVIPGASARIENRLIKSGNILLEVISKADAYDRRRKSSRPERNEDNFLSPGEDPYAKIQRNLFIKVMVDKRTCFVGEPVTAVFKLYSRLDSKSDIVKNPGFYGFTVQDMVNLANRVTSNEVVNGKEFDVHTVRKVQLYPLQAGNFTIDAMEVRNKVIFSKSEVNKKAEQEIAEGVFHDYSIASDATKTVFENSMNTESVAITVKPSPLENKPADYSGATGNFKLAASLQKKELAKNEEGDLVITISGKGNFTQLSAPVIEWPAGIDGFEPQVNDQLDQSQSPLTGKREFHFRFVSNKPGGYNLPALGLSFFDPDTNNYNTVYSAPVHLSISNVERSMKKIEAIKGKVKTNRKYRAWWIAGALTLVGLSLVTWKAHKKNSLKVALPSVHGNDVQKVEDILQTANTFLAADDKSFYHILRNCIWSFFTVHFGLTGSKMNKAALVSAMHEKKIGDASKKKILDILDQCETGIFTSVDDVTDKRKLFDSTKEILEKVSGELS
jgi:hypothetical protein